MLEPEDACDLVDLLADAGALHALTHERIADVANTITVQLKEIFTETRDQIENVASVSEETAASAEEVAAAADEMSSSLEDLAAFTNELSMQSSESTDLIKRFNL